MQHTRNLEQQLNPICACTYLAPLTLVLAASATAAAPPTPPVDVVLTRFLDMGGVRAGGGGERLIREATSSRMSLKWGQMITGGGL